MRFMVMAKATKNSDVGMLPTPDLLAASLWEYKGEPNPREGL